MIMPDLGRVIHQLNNVLKSELVSGLAKTKSPEASFIFLARSILVESRSVTQDIRQVMFVANQAIKGLRQWMPLKAATAVLSGQETAEVNKPKFTVTQNKPQAKVGEFVYQQHHITALLSTLTKPIQPGNVYQVIKVKDEVAIDNPEKTFRTMTLRHVNTELGKFYPADKEALLVVREERFNSSFLSVNMEPVDEVLVRPEVEPEANADLSLDVSNYYPPEILSTKHTRVISDKSPKLEKVSVEYQALKEEPLQANITTEIIYPTLKWELTNLELSKARGAILEHIYRAHKVMESAK